MRDLDIKVAACQAISFSRIYGWVMAVGEEDVFFGLEIYPFSFSFNSSLTVLGSA